VIYRKNDHFPPRDMRARVAFEMLLVLLNVSTTIPYTWTACRNFALRERGIQTKMELLEVGPLIMPQIMRKILNAYLFPSS